MSKYLKREDVIQLFIDGAFDEFPSSMKRELAEKAVESIPVLEVVRCKDCMYNDRGWCGAQEYGTRYVEDNDYCSYGEHKDGENK